MLGKIIKKITLTVRISVIPLGIYLTIGEYSGNNQISDIPIFEKIEFVYPGVNYVAGLSPGFKIYSLSKNLRIGASQKLKTSNTTIYRVEGY